MATIPTQQITKVGLSGATGLTNVTAADKFQPGTVLEIVNTSGSACDVVVDSKTPCNQGGDHNVSVTVPMTTGRVEIGPFQAQQYAGSDGLVDVTFSTQTNVQARAKRT